MHVYHHVDFWTIQNFLSHTMWRFVVTWCEMVSRDVVSSDEVDVTKSVTTWRHYVMIRNNGIKDISTKWLSDLKSGFCKTQFYMNKERFSIGQLKSLIIGQFNTPFWLVDIRKLKKKQCCWSDINQGRLKNISYPSGSLPVGNIHFRFKPEILIHPNIGFDGDTCEEWVEYGDSKTILGQTGLFFMYCLMGTMLAGLTPILHDSCSKSHEAWLIFNDSFRSGGDICKVFGPLCMRKRYSRSQNNFIWLRHAWLSRFWNAYSQGKNNHV